MTPLLDNEGHALAAEVSRVFPQWGMDRLTRIATGLEATVFRGEARALGPLALKVPLVRYIENDNDRGLDARDLLHQDAFFFEHSKKHHLPTPQFVALHFGQAVDFLAYRYVQTDTSTCSAEKVGRLVRCLHDTPLPNFIPVAHRGQPKVEETLARLTHERLSTIRRLSNQASPDVSLEVLTAAMTSYAAPRSLLHMDIRASNLLCADGAVVALIDWSNAVLADPLFELSRMAEYGFPMDGLIRGYGRDVFAERPVLAVIAARLYTAAMLTVVFLSEAPDKDRAAVCIDRIQTLLDDFVTAS